MDSLSSAANLTKSFVNGFFIGKEPWQITSITATTVLSLVWLWNIVNQPESCSDRLKKNIFSLIKKIPSVRRKIQKQFNEVEELFIEEIEERVEGLSYLTSLPEVSPKSDEILNMVERYLSLGKYNWKEGYVSGAIYHYDENLVKLLTEVYGLASYTNPLHPDVFPGVCKMEAEIIRMVAELFHGNDATCGSVTSGGTESIMMACKAYRDYAKERKGIKNAVILMPVSAHPAFDKAASYFNMTVKHIPLDSEMRVDVNAMEKAITKNTVMLVGSTPNFPYGTMDDIEAIAQLGIKYGIPVHVDCCLGSFIMAFIEKAGHFVPPFDFAVPGVTSISVDTHKYGFAPKGSSLIMYSDKDYIHCQYFVSLSWPGGVYGSACVSGSRSGGIIAACWATLVYFGKPGYLEATEKIVSTAKYIENGLRKIEGIFVFGTPRSTVIAFGSNHFHIYRLGNVLAKNNWNLNLLQFPFGIHICVTHLHTRQGVANRFLEQVSLEVKRILREPNLQLEGKVAMYGMSTTLPDRSIVGDITKVYLDTVYHTPKIKKSNARPRVIEDDKK